VQEVAPREERQSRRCSCADGHCIGLAVRGNLNADRLGPGVLRESGSSVTVKKSPQKLDATTT
jgi:hypothetical protein